MHIGCLCARHSVSVGAQGTTWKSQLSPLIFLCILGMEFRPSGSLSNLSYLSHLVGPELPLLLAVWQGHSCYSLRGTAGLALLHWVTSMGKLVYFKSFSLVFLFIGIIFSLLDLKLDFTKDFFSPPT